MRKFKTLIEKMEEKIYCFGGGGGGGGGSASPDPTREVGQNTRVDSRGNRVNFNTRSTVQTAETPTFTKTLPNGVEVVDFSTPFQGQVNLSNQSSLGQGSLTGSRDMYDALTTNLAGRSVPTMNMGMQNLSGISASPMDMFNTGAPVSPADAMNQALSAGQIGDGRIGLGGGFSAGRVPGGFGFQFDTAFAKGGAVESQGIASLMRKK